MTKSQAKAVEMIRKEAERTLFFGSDKSIYEFKEWTVEEGEYFVNVVLEVGRKGDEGTMAAIVCRDRAQFFIGKRGGITYPMSKTCKNGKHKWWTKPYTSVLSAVIDQRI